MKKASTLPAAAGETTTAVPGDGTAEYRIRPGVRWINGTRTRGAKTVRLSAEQATFDLGLGRLSLASDPVPKDWPTETSGAGAGDGGN